MEYGFVSICLSEEDCSPAGNVSVKVASALTDEGALTGRLMRVAVRNLTNTLRIMWFMNANGLRLYRFASHLVPLATHEMTRDWEWWADPGIKDLLKKVGALVKRFDYRVSMHLPDYCVMTSTEEKFKIVRGYMEYFVVLFNLMGVDNPVVVTHVGGKYGNPALATERMESNFLSLPESARRLIVLENDDTTYSARETLEVCQRLGVPMVLDIHHHQCRNDGEGLGELLGGIFATWEGRGRPPKIHVSSPKSEREPKAHADFVDPRWFLAFLETALGFGTFDVMVEAKMKDLAALKLIEAVPAHYRPSSGTRPPTG